MKSPTFALGGLAGSAIFLAGIGSAAPAAAQSSSESSFTGPRVEVQAGWEQLGFDLADHGIDDTETESGLGYGPTVGYDVPIGSNLVGGIEATLDHG